MAQQNWNGTTDNELMRLVCGDDKAAFTELMRRYGLRVRNTIGKAIWGDGAVAEDLTQDVFLKLWEKRATWRGDGKISTYIFTTVRNRCASYILNEKKKRGKPLLDDSAGIAVIEPGFNQVDARDLCKALFGALDTIPERFRVPLVLFAYAGLKEQEIAALLNVTVPTVEHRLAMARRMLRERTGE